MPDVVMSEEGAENSAPTRKGAHFAPSSSSCTPAEPLSPLEPPSAPEYNGLFRQSIDDGDASKAGQDSKGFKIGKWAFGSGGSPDHPDAAAGPKHEKKAQFLHPDHDDEDDRIVEEAHRMQAIKNRVTMVEKDPNTMPQWRVKVITLMQPGGNAEAVTAVVIMANAVVMALESEMPQAYKTWELLDQIFLVYYTLELALRFLAFRTNSLKGIANNLDWTIVLVGWLQILMAGAAAEQMSAMNALKVLRALRVLRCIRMLAYVEGLWLVVQSFFYCLKPLMWVCLFMVVIVFIFAMFTVEMIGSSKDFDGVEEREYFARTVTAFVTLFQIMTLDEWREIIQPLCDKRGWAYVFFFVYISISALALMNLITAVVVENSMKRIEADEEYRNMMFERASQLETEKIQALLEFFQVRDAGDDRKSGSSSQGTGTESMDEAVVSPDDLLMAKGAWSALENVLDALGMDEPEDVQKLFELLDADGNGELSLNEVIDGLFQLRTVAEDKYKTALIQAMPSHCGKFDLLGRFCQHLPETSTRRLQAIERRLGDIQNNLYARIEEVQTRKNQRDSVGTGSDALRSTASTSESFGPPTTTSASFNKAGQEFKSSVTLEVLNELKTFRTEVNEEVQRQALELRRQGGELKKHQEAVDQLLTAMVYHELGE